MGSNPIPAIPVGGCDGAGCSPEREDSPLGGVTTAPQNAPHDSAEVIANVLSLSHQGTPEREWRFALCRCDRTTGKLEVVKRTLARTRDEAVAFFGAVSPEMFVASLASLAVTGVMPVGKAEFRGRRASA